MATLQKQGVPIPDKLTGPQPGSVNGPQTRSSSPSRTSSGTATRRQASTSTKPKRIRQSRSAVVPDIGSDSSVNSASSGGNGGSGAGLLEAEFLTAVGILVLLMFASDASMTDRMMSVMKRGTLVCAVFFILAIVSGIGSRADKVAKAFGALVIVAILVTSPMSTVLTDLDNIIKNDWIGTPASPTGGASGSADNGTQVSTGGSGGDFSAAERAALASIGEGDTLGKLFNPADEAKGTLDTVKAIGDTLSGLAKKFLGI
jgi:hypothetical protein